MIKQGFIQMRVTAVEKKAILAGAQRSGQTMTDFIKKAVLDALRRVSKVEPARDEFWEELQRISSKEKVAAPAEIRKLFPGVRKAVAEGRLKTVGIDEARRIIRSK